MAGVAREQLSSLGGRPQASMKLLNGEDGIGGEAHGIELRVIDLHLTDIGLGSLGSWIREVGSQIVECRVDRAEVVGEPVPDLRGGSRWSASIVVQEYERHVVPILGCSS